MGVTTMLRRLLRRFGILPRTLSEPEAWDTIATQLATGALMPRGVCAMAWGLHAQGRISADMAMHMEARAQSYVEWHEVTWSPGTHRGERLGMVIALSAEATRTPWEFER